jgi:PD-(D/E)XK nuclease superfamily
MSLKNTQKSATNPLEQLVALDSALKATRIVMDKYESDMTSNFNSLYVLNVSEIHLTKAITWLLTPNEDHHQKHLFLDAFVASYFDEKDRNNWGKLTHVSSEKSIEVGQLDIHIEYEHFSIIIENKIWGKDDPEQLDKYIEWCEKRKKDYAVIFLTMTGQKPRYRTRWDNNNSKKTICISYKKDIHQWLRKNNNKCTASKVKFFISEILQWIEFNIEVEGGRKIMTEGDVIAKLITSDVNKFKMLWDVTNTFDFNKYLTQQVVSEARELLVNLADEKLEHYEIIDNNDTLFSKTKQGWISWQKKTIGTENNPLTYTVETHNWTDDLIIGISKKESNLSCSNEEQIFDCVRNMCNTYMGTTADKNAWWVGYFSPQIFDNRDREKYEFEMAWHLANPENRNKLINNIVDTLKKLIESTRNKEGYENTIL